MTADKQKDVLLNPRVIFEVLSLWTERYDRGIKLQHYRAIESLHDYILVSQDQVLIEQYTRGDSETWAFRDYHGLEETLRIPSIGISLPLSGIYEGIDVSAE